MTWSSQSRVTRMVESLRVIGLQARVNVESYKISNFSYIYLAVGPPVDLQWLQVCQLTFSGYRSASGPAVAIGPPKDLQWLLVRQWIFSGYRSSVDLQWLQVHQWIFSGYRSPNGPSVAIGPPVDLQWLQVRKWVFSGGVAVGTTVDFQFNKHICL